MVPYDKAFRFEVIVDTFVGVRFIFYRYLFFTELRNVTVVYIWRQLMYTRPNFGDRNWGSQTYPPCKLTASSPSCIGPSFYMWVLYLRSHLTFKLKWASRQLSRRHCFPFVEIIGARTLVAATGFTTMNPVHLWCFVSCCYWVLSCYVIWVKFIH